MDDGVSLSGRNSTFDGNCSGDGGRVSSGLSLSGDAGGSTDRNCSGVGVVSLLAFLLVVMPTVQAKGNAVFRLTLQQVLGLAPLTRVLYIHSVKCK